MRGLCRIATTRAMGLRLTARRVTIVCDKGDDSNGPRGAERLCDRMLRYDDLRLATQAEADRTVAALRGLNLPDVRVYEAECDDAPDDGVEYNVTIEYRPNAIRDDATVDLIKRTVAEAGCVLLGSPVVARAPDIRRLPDVCEADYQPHDPSDNGPTDYPHDIRRPRF